MTLERAEFFELELAIGPWTVSGQSASDATLRRAWEALRDRMLGDWRSHRPGERPWSWWEYDASGEMPSDIADTRRLVELGVLAGEELADVSRLGEESVAAQVAGTIASLSVPAVVRRAQVVRLVLGLPPLDEAPFHRYSAAVRDH